MYRLKSLVYLIIIFVIILFFHLEVSAVGVKPLVLDYNMEPGQQEEFELIFTPGNMQETVILSLYNPTQNLTGGLNYSLGDPNIHPMLDWVRLEDEEIIINRGEETIVKGKIEIPYDAEGSHTAIIMVEPVEQEQENEVFYFKLRYAVRLNIDIDKPGQRPRAEMTEIKFERNEEGNPIVYSHIKNVSSVNFDAQAEATIRDENNRLIERLNIASKVAARGNRISTKIYPNSEVIFSGELSQPLYPGEYTLQVYLKYGDNRQLVERKTITLEEELRKSGPRRYISFEPEIISDNLQAGAPSTQVIEINNLFNEEIKVKINPKELFEKGQHSLFNIGELQMRGGEEFVLEPRKSARSVMIFRSPRDASAGGYYGQLELEVFDKNDELLETRNIDLEMMIGEGWEYNAEINNFKFENQEGVQSFSFELKNLSSAHINPGAMVILKNGSDQIIKTVNLSAPEEVEKLLPEKSVNLIGKTTQIEAGTYNAEIVVTNNNQEIERMNTSVDVN